MRHLHRVVDHLLGLEELLRCPADLAEQIPYIGGEECPFSYGELQVEIDLINRAYIDVMCVGDAKGRAFTFPIPTYNITRDFDWEHPNCDALFEMKARYGIYFKGGMGAETQEGCVENKAVHAIFPGGCAVLAATQVEEIEGQEWQDLGMPETLWVNRVREFGPLIISIDTKGRNLIDENKARFAEKKKPILERINAQVRFIK